jgi:hypothetical protein
MSSLRVARQRIRQCLALSCLLRCTLATVSQLIINWPRQTRSKSCSQSHVATHDVIQSECLGVEPHLGLTTQLLASRHTTYKLKHRFKEYLYYSVLIRWWCRAVHKSDILTAICEPILKVMWDLRFEVFTALTMKNSVFWDVTPCGSCKNRRFGGTYRLLHQGDKNRSTRNNVSRN